MNPANAAQRTLLNKVDLCGCGHSQWDVILYVLERAENPDQMLYDEEPCEQRWMEFVAKVLDKWELLEHGTGIGAAWLTDDGAAMLEWLREHGTDDSTWPANWCDSVDCPCSECKSESIEDPKVPKDEKE